MHLHFLLLHRVLFETHAVYLLISSDTAPFYFHILSSLFCVLGHQIQILASGSFVLKHVSHSFSVSISPSLLFFHPLSQMTGLVSYFPWWRHSVKNASKGMRQCWPPCPSSMESFVTGSQVSVSFLFYVFLKYFRITVMSWNFVPFVWTESFTDEQHLWFLEFYKKLCCLGLQHENGHCESQPYPLELENKYALVRRNCAYNFPVSFPALHP